VVVRRSLRRAQVIPFFTKLPPCLIGIEACGTSHHWARELVGLGHEVRLMPPAYVKPYVKRGKSDAGDAEAICEAVSRPTMRFVPIKSVEQQSALALHRTRDLLVRQRTQLVNMIRGLLAEFGIDIPKGITHALAFVRRAVAGDAHEVADLAAKVIGPWPNRRSRSRAASGSSNETFCPGTARMTSPDASRPCPAWACSEQPRWPPPSPTRPTSDPDVSSRRGWASPPLNNSSGGKERLGRISKMGDQYLRRLLVTGMTSLVRRNGTTRDRPILA
jgi:transposase